MRARLVVTGTEVLEGRVRDENGAAIAAALTAAGVTVERITVVGDALGDIVAAVEEALQGAPDLVVTTGGLGPTHDDRTMEAVATATGTAMVVHGPALDMVKRAIASVPARASEDIRERGAVKQATLPEGSTPLRPAGTAPGAVLAHGGTVLVVLPGPPWECMAGWEEALAVPAVATVLGADPGAAPIDLRMAGVVESEFMQAIDGLGGEDNGLVVGVCARPGELEVTVRPPGPAASAFIDGLDRAFPGAIFSRDGAEVEEVVGSMLVARGERMGTAESCTGGMIGARLTAVAGSSEWFAGGVVSYSNDVKESALGVPAELLLAHGAVSEQVAIAMADGARRHLRCDWSVAVTGIAGPGGGTDAKPVGLVYVSIAGPADTSVRELRLHGDRERIRMRSATIALHLLREALGA